MFKILDNIIKKISWKVNRPELYKEAFFAYLDRLPNKIGVEWFRDDDFIIGKIKADDSEFMTQARSAKEFVEMVNDALLAAYEIPEQYFDLVLHFKMFRPTKEQFDKLNDAAVIKSSFDIIKNREFAIA